MTGSHVPPADTTPVSSSEAVCPTTMNAPLKPRKQLTPTTSDCADPEPQLHHPIMAEAEGLSNVVIALDSSTDIVQTRHPFDAGDAAGASPNEESEFAQTGFGNETPEILDFEGLVAEAKTAANEAGVDAVRSLFPRIPTVPKSRAYKTKAARKKLREHRAQK